jgi:hypothetical protein
MPKSQFDVIRNGTKGIVFKISDKYAAKVLFSGNVEESIDEFTICNNLDALKRLKYEVEINSKLYEKGVSVPVPVGIEELVLFFDEKYPAFVMQYLPYPSGAELKYPDSEKAIKLAKAELVKAVDANFAPGRDCLNPNNYLYDARNNRTYLIDFERWQYEGGETK